MCINTCMWNLEKWYRLALFLGSYRDADIENGHAEIHGRGWGGVNWEIEINIYKLPSAKQKASGKVIYSTGSSAQSSVTI